MAYRVGDETPWRLDGHDGHLDLRPGRVRVRRARARLAFDESAWTAARAATPTSYERASPVAEDVVKCEDLVYGKDGSSIVQLLGRPDWKSKKEDVWGYDVGVPEELSDYPGLVITFDDDGTVETAEIPGYYER